MVKIDERYDVILTYSPIQEITGHVFECFDYYLFLRDYYRVGILFLGGLEIEQLKTAWESKYIVGFDQVENDIIKVDEQTLDSNRIYKFGKDTVVILCDGNINSLNYRRIFLATENLMGFMCGQYGFEKVKTNNHIVYLQDYRIYGRNKNFKSYDYVKKLPFKHYRISQKKFDNTGLMYVTYACRKITPQMIQDYHIMSGCTKTLLAVPYKLPEYDFIDGVEQVLAPMENFFDRFDTYIYTPVHRKFDCSPRLVTECFLQNKKMYMNLDYMDIGLETRMNDCKNNFQSLNLKDGDQIVDLVDRCRGKQL